MPFFVPATFPSNRDSCVSNGVYTRGHGETSRASGTREEREIINSNALEERVTGCPCGEVEVSPENGVDMRSRHGERYGVPVSFREKR